MQAYRAALEVRTRKRVPPDWASTQTNLGSALAALGERETGTERFEQAVHAHRSALVVFTVEDLPQYHKIAQDNLQIALLRLQARRAEPGSATAPD